VSAPPNSEPAAPTARWIPAPGEPHDRCAKCGRPTPIGTSLCPDDNPGGIGAPSATQAHGTIFVGVLAGFVALALAARVALGSAGPFSGAIESAVTRPDGGVDVAVRVTNQGSSTAPANCRISRGGLAEPDDPVFVTERLQPAESRAFVRTIPPRAAGQRPFAIERLTVVCR
jgi:hypothetical protein